MCRFCAFFLSFFLVTWNATPVLAQVSAHSLNIEPVIESNDFLKIDRFLPFRQLARVNQLYDDVFHQFSNADSIHYTYMSSGSPDIDLNYSWNGASWDLTYRTLHTYTPGSQPWIAIGQNFLGQWENAKKDSFGYGSNLLTSDKTSFYFHPGLQEWISSKRSLYTYSAFDQLTQQTDQNYIQSVWVNQMRYLSSYAPDSTLLSYFTERWDSTLVNWKAERRTDYFYDSSKNLINAMLYRWNPNDSSWYHLQKWTVSYDSLSRPLTYLFENFDTLSSSYYNGSLLNYTYDADGNLIYSLFQNWIVQELEWENENQFFYYYEPVTGIKELADKNVLRVYPNPATTKIQLSFSEDQNMFCDLWICNSIGQFLISQSSIRIPTQVDVSSFPKGNYTVLLRTKEGTRWRARFLIE